MNHQTEIIKIYHSNTRKSSVVIDSNKEYPLIIEAPYKLSEVLHRF